MNSILLGNIFSLGAMLSDSFSGTRKTSKQMLYVQCVSQVFYFGSAFVLKGYSACVQNVVAVARNICAARGIGGRVLEVLFVVLPVILGLIVNNRALLGLLPIVANLEYSIALFLFKDKPIRLKCAFILNALLFLVFNLIIYNFVAAVSCAVIIVSTTVSVITTKKNAASSSDS